MRVQINSRSAVAITTPFWTLMLLTACGTSPEEPAPEPTDAIAYDGGRIIVGDGGVIENGTLLVEGDRILAVGGTDSVDVPAGAERIDLTGRTLMPAIIDTHVHLRETRDELVEDLQRKAYYGVSAVLSLGRGVSELAFQLRDEVVTNAARYLTVGRGITAPETWPYGSSLVDHNRSGSEGGGTRTRAPERRHGENLGRRPKRSIR